MLGDERKGTGERRRYYYRELLPRSYVIRLTAAVRETRWPQR